MTREQWLKDQIRSLEQHIDDEVNQARIAFLQEVLRSQQETLAQWRSPDPEEHSPELVRSDIDTRSCQYIVDTGNRYRFTDCF